MQYFVKITTAAGTKVISDPFSPRIEFDINDFDVCVFGVPTSVTGLRQFQRVEFIRANDSEETDTTLFSGTIFSIKASIEQLEITCRSDKALLQKKLVVSDRTVTARAANLAIGDLIGDWNTAYSESWSVSSSITTAITKDFKKGDTLFDAIDEIAGLVGCVWRVDGTVIKMETLLGTDRSIAGANYVLVEFDKLDPDSSNCGNVVVETYSTRSNIIIGSDGTTKTTASDAVSIAEIGPFAEYKEFRSGSLASQTSEYLASKKDEQKLITVSLETSVSAGQTAVPTERHLAKEDDGAILQENSGEILIDQATPGFVRNPLADIRCGDKIRLFLANCGEYFDFDGAVIVNRLTLKIVSNTEFVTIGLSDAYAYVNDGVKILQQISSQVYLQSL